MAGQRGQQFFELGTLKEAPARAGFLLQPNFWDGRELVVFVRDPQHARLKQNRFVVIKIGDVRDEKGFYRNLAGDSVSTFLRLGLKLYNMAISVTPIGTLPMRSSAPFEKYRKLSNAHQYVQCFFKGEDAKAASTTETKGLLRRIIVSPTLVCKRLTADQSGSIPFDLPVSRTDMNCGAAEVPSAESTPITRSDSHNCARTKRG